MYSKVALRLLIAAATMATMACGHKAPPFPPPLETPARTVDLAVQQRGATAVLSFTYPQLTAAGELLGAMDRIEVWAVKKPVTPPMAEVEEGEMTPEAEPGAEDTEAEDAETAKDIFKEADDGTEEADGGDDEVEDAADEAEDAAEEAEELLEIRLEDQTAVDILEFNASAQLVETVDAEAVDQAVDGAHVVLRVELGETSHEEWSRTFAVRTVAAGELISEYSNLVTLVQRRPPPEPTDFQLTAEASGIRLSWSLPEPAEALMVYRRSSQSRLYGEAIAVLGGDAVEHLDSSAAFGERYIYAVTAVGQYNPLTESFFGGEREIDYADRFAPAAPTNLIALAEAGRVRLLWDASVDDDTSGYVIFRRPASGTDFRRLTEEPVIALEFSDRTVQAGTTYEYSVAAVDTTGNQGEQGSTVTARVP